MGNESPSVWEKFDIEEYKVVLRDSATLSPAVVNASEPRPSPLGLMGKRWFRTTLNVIATLFGLYALLKLFVTDLDRWVVSEVAPSWLWILDYRFFLVLFVATLLFLITKQWTAVLTLSYIWFFPLIVLLWKLPQLYYRRRSWNLVIGSLQVFWSLGKSIRFALLAFTVFAFATLAIALDGPNSLLAIAVVTLLVLWMWLVLRALVYAFVPSKFVVSQQKTIGNILDSDHVWAITGLPPAAKNTDVTRLNKGQIDQLVSQASKGLVLYAVSAVWAEKLDQYRKSGTSVVFSAFAVAALVTQGLTIFTLVNLGMYRIDRSEFLYPESPHIATFVRYSLSSMYAGEIEALRPAGTWASVVNVAETVSCGLLELVLFVSLVFSLKQTRDDEVAEDSIQAMRRKADAYAEKLTGEYRLPLRDLLDRIVELNGLFGSWTRQMVYAVVAAHRRAGRGDEHS